MSLSFILDCSVIISGFLEDEQDKYSIEVFESLRIYKAIAPYLLNYEFSNVLLTGLRRGRITEAQVLEAINLFNKLPILIDNTHIEMNNLILLSHKYGLTTYDGSYLNLSLTTGLPLATKDNNLITAVQKTGGKIYQP